MKRLTNNLRHRAQLLTLQSGVDPDTDRPVRGWQVKRTLLYQTLGVTATEKYLSAQAKTDVVNRIRIRLDSTITQRGSRVRINEVDYKITRIYVDDDQQMEELSLDYVNVPGVSEPS